VGGTSFAWGNFAIEVGPPVASSTPSDGLSNFTSTTTKVPAPFSDAYCLELAGAAREEWCE
jgi:hypothetical protein